MLPRAADPALRVAYPAKLRPLRLHGYPLSELFWTGGRHPHGKNDTSVYHSFCRGISWPKGGREPQVGHHGRGEEEERLQPAEEAPESPPITS